MKKTSSLIEKVLKGEYISNYSKDDYQCNHNVDIWYGAEYLGCGPGASSFYAFNRRSNVSSIEEWFNNRPSELDIIPESDRICEIFIMGLRTSQGWDRELFFQRTGCQIDYFSEKIDFLINNKLMENESGRVFCTEKGLLVWNSIAEYLM